MATFGTVTAEEVNTKRAAGDRFRLIDVREPGEHLLCHIEGAELRPLGGIAEWMLGLPDKNEEIILHCHHGMRSERACVFLAQQGFTNVKNMAGGIDYWSLRVDPGIPRY